MNTSETLQPPQAEVPAQLQFKIKPGDVNGISYWYAELLTYGQIDPEQALQALNREYSKTGKKRIHWRHTSNLAEFPTQKLVFTGKNTPWRAT